MVAQARQKNHLWLAFGREGGGSGGRRVEMAEMDHLRLAFGREGGGGGGTGSRIDEKTTSGSHLDAREVVVVGDVLKERKTPPPARNWMRGRWWWWVTCRKNEKNHLRLAFGRKGGGGGGSLGIRGVSGRRRKNEWEKTGNDICRCLFS